MRILNFLNIIFPIYGEILKKTLSLCYCAVALLGACFNASSFHF